LQLDGIRHRRSTVTRSLTVTGLELLSCCRMIVRFSGAMVIEPVVSVVVVVTEV
jgi:hypothetical protein